MSSLYQSLLDRTQDNHMARSIDSGNWEGVSVKIDDGNLHLPPNEVSLRAKALTEERDELTKSGPSMGHESRRRLEDVLVSTSILSSWGHSRRVRGATQSRLMDPPSSLLRKNDDEEDDMDEDMLEDYALNKCSVLTMAEWVSLVLVIAALFCSRSIPALRKQILWDLALWKWEVMGLVIICGGLVSDWGVRLSVHLMERNFLLRKRVLYFVYGLRRVVRNCLWLVLVLIVWECIFYQKVEMETHSKALPYVTKVLVCLLVSTLIWLIKIILVKALASSFHMNTFFDEIQELLVKQYVINKLLKAKDEKPGNFGADILGTKSGFPGSKKDSEISIDHLDKLSRRNVSAWNMKILMDKVHYRGLSTLDELILHLGIGNECPLEEKNGCRATKAAEKILKDIAASDPQYIYLGDLVRFMSESDAEKTMECIGGKAECEKISKATLKNWVVSAIKEGRKLASSLNDTKTAVDELHRMLDVFVAVLVAIICLLILGVPITHFLLFISSQLLLVVFVFGNTCKTTFEAIIFLFVMHPYDVGDRCEIDGNQVVVEEMNILTTVFLRSDNQMVIYPNSVLATKPICNYKRSMDIVEAIAFCIHISTPVKKIATFKEKIKRYVERKSDHWYPDPMIIIKDVEELNKLKMAVYLTHTMNGQNSVEIFTRRSLLVEEMIKVFRELEIEYRMLPLDVNIRTMPGLVSLAAS
ncbi:mechanosensitive ion channel protein 8-like [Vitis riparia]|uniref:mechanosensitive ion channel protein 8-like n=1 Tax=Vitis riparia TaxID=96939 RepID=UPI00155A0F02|nr:mechanosensitive ion channel protein 8-like [Vitis riparia]